MIVLSDIWVNFREVDHRFSHIFLQSVVRYVCHVFPCKFVYLFGRVLPLFLTYKTRCHVLFGGIRLYPT